MNSRRKGKRGELEAAAEIRRLFGTDARRSVQHCGRAGTSDLTDGSIPGCHVEVKTVARIGAVRYLKQAERDAGGGRLPLVVMRENRGVWHVLLTLESFARIYLHHAQREEEAEKVTCHWTPERISTPSSPASTPSPPSGRSSPASS